LGASFFYGSVRGDWMNLKRLVNDESKPELTVHQFSKLLPQ
jgi:hypothetical protein